MLLNKALIQITKLLLLVILFSFTGFTQQKSPEQRQREHQAVYDYFNWKYPQYPINTTPSNSKSLKYGNNRLSKITGPEDRKNYLMNGNNVTCEVWNYGGIGGGLPSASIRELLDMVWRDLPYIFQFTPLVGALVDTGGTNKVPIITDALYDYDGLREEDPADGSDWTWEPLPGYADPDQPNIASNPGIDSDRDGKPDSWPRDWYNETLGEYVWPGFLVQGENNADLEVYWAMDDRNNKEFPYYPYVNDTTKQGLGVQIDGRGFQWANSLAANTIFFVWTITNVSDKSLDSVFFGIYGDPDIGGLDNDDDNGFFIPPYGPGVDDVPVYARSMVYFWDPDMTGDRGLPVYYLGCKFLESPGNPTDGIDNDGDGIVDESQDDGIDNDGDWNVETDDVGVDGIPNTGDTGEGDGVPTRGLRLSDGRPDPLAPGEPNFEYTDLDEADQIGLTSFNSWAWNEDKISNDASMWARSIPGNFGDIQQNADLVFIFGSGYISLQPGETKRISMAFLFGQTLPDLLVTAETVQDIYNKNYRFFKPPSLPVLSAVPDDKKVTLYWDTNSEESLDPITGKDFEGYVIYRSTRSDFGDIQNITDGRGSKFLYEPLKDLRGYDAKFDLDNEWFGYHPVEYQGRGVSYYLGDNTGLVHTFVDSNNVINGQKYYYAVCAYDHGDSLGIPPSETTKKITVDAISSQEVFDVNTVAVVPGPRASGYENPGIQNTNILHPSGLGNGVVDFSVLNDLALIDENYTLTFSDTLFLSDTTILAKNYSVLGEKTFTESFYLYDTKYTNLSRQNILNDQFLVVKDKNGTIYQNEIDYQIEYARGAIKRLENSSMPNISEFEITYRNYAVYQSQALKFEDSNPVFDGIKVKVNSFDRLAFDAGRSNWSSELDLPFNLFLRTGGNPIPQPADYLVTFSSENISLAKKFVGGRYIDIPVKYKVEDVTTGIPVEVVTALIEAAASNDSAWTIGEEIIIYPKGSPGGAGERFGWSLVVSKGSDPTVIPTDGDVLMLYTTRPFTKEDVFTLQTKSGYVNNQLASASMDNIYVVPNPYIGTNELEPANRLPSQNRGERRIYFENLPMKCTIRIYTLSGELVTALDHESTMENGREYWNLLNRDGFSIAYGIYLAHIDAPGVGEKLIKFAIIK